MKATDISDPVSKMSLWTGSIMSAVSCLMMLFSVGIKAVQPAGVFEHFAVLGWTVHQLLGLSILELACTIIYLLPRTSVLGAILLTGYLGGAAAAHLRIGEVSVAIFPISLAIVLWIGLYLRDPRLRALIPLRR